MRRVRLLIADDHPLMVEAIRVALSGVADFEVVGVAGTGEQALEFARRLEPDAVLLDLRLPGIDGFEVLRRLRCAHPGAKLVVLSASDEPEVVDVALRAGASAFITKRIDPLDLPAALRQVVNQTLFQPFRPNPLVQLRSRGDDELTERELSVLRGVADGMSNKQIATRLSYAEQTVKLDLTHVYRKLGVSTRTEAMAVAYRLGLIQNEFAESGGRG